MISSLQVAAPLSRLTHTGRVFLVISLLLVLALIAAVVGVLHPASAPFAGLMAATNGDIFIGST
jgi:hypothetical protein